jgi:hypothetical protein
MRAATWPASRIVAVIFMSISASASQAKESARLPGARQKA